MLSWRSDHWGLEKDNPMTTSSVEHEKQMLVKTEPTACIPKDEHPNRRVSFSQDINTVIIPCHDDLQLMIHDIWWNRSDLINSSKQATFTIQEIMNINPSLTIQSAMCLLYQNVDMFSSRLRLLIVNNDGNLAAATRSKILTHFRDNIWSIQCCSYETARKVIEKKTICFDIVIIDCDSTRGLLMDAKELLGSFRQLYHHHALIGLTFMTKCEVNSLDLNHHHIDFIWNGSMNATEYIGLRHLIAMRYLRGADAMNNNNNECIPRLVYSYPFGYKFVHEEITTKF